MRPGRWGAGGTTAGTPRWAGSPRWITSGRWRERSPRDRGPVAARPRTRRRRLRRRCPSPQGCRVPGRGTRRARVRGRPYGVKPVCGQGNREPSSCPAHVHAKTALTPETSATPQAGSMGQAPACPAQGGPGPEPLPGEHRRTPGNEVNWRSIIRRNGEITRISYEEPSTVGGEPRWMTGGYI